MQTGSYLFGVCSAYDGGRMVSSAESGERIMLYTLCFALSPNLDLCRGLGGNTILFHFFEVAQLLYILWYVDNVFLKRLFLIVIFSEPNKTVARKKNVAHIVIFCRSEFHNASD